MIEFKNVSVNYQNHIFLKDITCQVETGNWLMLVGPNGAGKSTLVKTLSNGVEYEGEVLLDHQRIRNIDSKKRAQKIAILQQHYSADYDYTVKQVVELGRYAYSSGLFQRMTDEDYFYVDQALKDTGMEKYRETSIRKLSGGELQRTFLAQVLAQNPEVLILDEPTNHLDLKYEQVIFSLVSEWLKKPNKSVISIVHDLSLARIYGTHGLLIKEGKQKAFGRIDEVLTKENLAVVYEIDVHHYMQAKYQEWQ